MTAHSQTLVDCNADPELGGEIVELRAALSQSLAIEDVFAATEEVLRRRGVKGTSLTYFYIGREFMQKAREAQDRELAIR